VEILVDEHLLALGRRKLLERRDRRVEQRALERTACPLPVLGEIPDPPGGLLGKRTKRRPAGFQVRGSSPIRASRAVCGPASLR
jgi:hypothetical protein